MANLEHQLQCQQKEGQHMLPDQCCCFCLADICGVVGKGANGRVFAASLKLEHIGYEKIWSPTDLLLFSTVQVFAKHVAIDVCRTVGT